MTDINMDLDERYGALQLETSSIPESSRRQKKGGQGLVAWVVVADGTDGASATPANDNISMMQATEGMVCCCVCAPMWPHPRHKIHSLAPLSCTHFAFPLARRITVALLTSPRSSATIDVTHAA